MLVVLVPLPVVYKVTYSGSKEKIVSLIFQIEIPQDGSDLYHYLLCIYIHIIVSKAGHILVFLICELQILTYIIKVWRLM